MCRPACAPIKATVLAIVTGLCSACLPVVNHGPRIQPGWNGGLSGSLSLGPRYGKGDWGAMPFLLGPMGLNLAHGWSSTGHDRGALQVGVHVPASLLFDPPGVFDLGQADLYYQLPRSRTGRLDGGVGANIASGHVMPYFQLGQIGPNESGWYTTQGVGYFRRDGGFNTRLSAVAWVPSVAYQMGRPSVNFHWFISGAVGKENRACYSGGTCPPAEARYLLTAGVTIQFHRQR